ncbi:16S rRNA (guanine(527)-N(7))-methyltransferase RsmG [Thermosipho ferrireducens]|uniref:Ribosomal RNA small subunit methyltransferase G n=1 Tax=Thermosipho ferrireducens TaxID=2571116 RepID=A0ABX7S520_9BACT|nr:16S rRNA (guanine(527)-N(7))-methyltransferase RsmG [Thermosipho ferrireducens]QTA37214.1 16S rRNA (guanine(527)-N(7))-methyltransferase RsmG [Thermosipho ferrireducens]
MNQKVQNLMKEYVSKIINAPLNLTSHKDLEIAYQLLAVDSIKPIKASDIGEVFLDVGTGGGVPGVFLRMIFDVQGVLVDSSKKKISYVERICRELKIDRLEFIGERVENLRSYREKFDAVTAKAVAELRILLELTAPFAKVGGKLLLYKGPRWKEEYKVSENAMIQLGISLDEVREYEILNKKRFLLVFGKKFPAPEKYPRKYSQIIKKPL